MAGSLPFTVIDILMTSCLSARSAAQVRVAQTAPEQLEELSTRYLRIAFNSGETF